MTTPTLYPSGYGTQLLTLDALILRHMTQCEPETVLRVTQLILNFGGILGIGSGVRPCPSDVSDASRECKSFHQRQVFNDGTVWFCAFDFVYRNPQSTPAAPLPHIAPPPGIIPFQDGIRAGLPLPPSTMQTGIHANVGKPGTVGFEPWHGQPSEIDGFDSWHIQGRHRPIPVLTNYYNSPPEPPEPPDIPPYDLRTMNPFTTYLPLAQPQRFFDTRGFGVPSMPAGEYGVLPPYPAMTDGTIPGSPAGVPILGVNGTAIRGVKVGVKIITPTLVGFAAAYTFKGDPPGTSILDFAGEYPLHAGQPPAYNAIIDIPVTPVGEFCVFINVPAHIAVDLYGYWT
jgi:hypothetical protein